MMVPTIAEACGRITSMAWVAYLSVKVARRHAVGVAPWDGAACTEIHEIQHRLLGYTALRTCTSRSRKARYSQQKTTAAPAVQLVGRHGFAADYGATVQEEQLSCNTWGFISSIPASPKLD